MPGSLQNENGFSKKSSTLPSVASDFGEKINVFAEKLNVFAENLNDFAEQINDFAEK